MILQNSATAQLSSRHVTELAASAIAPEIIATNFRTIDGLEFEELILRAELEEAGGHSQYATAPIQRILKRNADARNFGGWYCAGVDLAGLKQYYDAWATLGDVDSAAWASLITRLSSLSTSDWGCFKPDKPRQQKFRKNDKDEWEQYEGKLIKYIHPGKMETSVFALDMPGQPRYWLKVLADETIPILITEGAKKAACGLSHGFVTIGLPGVNQWNKPKTRQLLDELALFARKGRKIYIAFDRDTKAKSVRSVNIAKSMLASALRRKKCDVYIVEWATALGKGLDDVIAAHGPKPIADAIANALPFEYWSLRHLSALSYKASYIVPAGQRFVDGAKDLDGKLIDGEVMIPFPEHDKFIAFVAPKGTGKTEAIRRLVDVATQNGQRVLFITHRVQLTQALCDRTGIPSIYQVNKGEADSSLGHGLCIQSLHADGQAAFYAGEWSDALIILDEVEQVLWDVLDSSTCKNSRVKILRELKQLVSQALSPETDGRLVIADADLSDISIDLFRGMVDDEPALNPWIVRSDYKGDAATFDVSAYGSNEQLMDATETALAAGQKLFVVTDSQKTKSRFSSSALEARWLKKFPEKKILRIDSATLARRDHPAFGCVSNLNAVITQGEYDVIITSPSVETGVSVDVRGYFSQVVGFFQGVMSENSVRQSLSRVRDNCPRNIVLPARGLSFSAAGELSAANIAATTDRQAKITLNMIRDAASLDLDSSFMPSATEAWAKFCARQNAGMSAYRTIVLAGLADEGHRVTGLVKPEAGSDEAELLKELGNHLTSDRHDRLKAEADAIVEAIDLTDATVAKLEKSASVKSEAEQLALKKAITKRMYPGHEMTPDLLIMHEYGWHPKIKLHYALTMGNQFVKDGDREKVESLIDGGAVWGNDINRSTLSLKVATLQLLKIDELIDLEEISNDSPEVITLAQVAFKSRYQLKAVLGFSISEAEMEKPVLIAKKFLALLGFGTGTATKTSRNGKTVRYYPVEIVDSKKLAGFDSNGEFIRGLYEYSTNRLDVFESWLERDVKKAEAAITAEESQGQIPTAETTKKGQARYRSIYTRVVCPDFFPSKEHPECPETKITPESIIVDGQLAAFSIKSDEKTSTSTQRAAILNAVSLDNEPLSDGFYRPSQAERETRPKN